MEDLIRHLVRNAKIHLQHTADSKSLKFMLYRILHIVNRRIKLPHVLFYADYSQRYEAFLEPYMIPKNAGCIIDVGANIGQWTSYFSDRGMVIHAFEPAPRIYTLLQKQFKGKDNIHIHSCALGEDHYLGKLKVHKHSGSNSLVCVTESFTGKEVAVQVRTLDSFHFRNVGLIKIDTEGYEIPVLLGAKETIQASHPRLIIETHLDYIDQKEKIVSLLEHYGYTWKLIYRPSGSKPHIIGDHIT